MMHLLKPMRLKSSVFMFSLVLGLIACTSEYTELVRDELESGIRQDSIFLGFKFGDPREAFFSKGWALNKQGLVMQGPKNQTVQYLLKPQDSLGSSIRLLFYPNFDSKERIKEMEITLDYPAWSPWSQRYSADSLLSAVKDTLVSWYGGNDFIPVEMDKGTIKYLWVKVDGNRRIVIHKKDEREVFGKISDLLNEEVLTKNKL